MNLTAGFKILSVDGGGFQQVMGKGRFLGSGESVASVLSEG